MQRPLFSDSAGSGRSSFGRTTLGTGKKTRFLYILLICSFIAAGGIGVSLLTSARAAKNDSFWPLRGPIFLTFGRKVNGTSGQHQGLMRRFCWFFCQ